MSSLCKRNEEPISPLNSSAQAICLISQIRKLRHKGYHIAQQQARAGAEQISMCPSIPWTPASSSTHQANPALNPLTQGSLRGLWSPQEWNLLCCILPTAINSIRSQSQVCGCVSVFLLLTGGIVLADQSINTESEKLQERFMPLGSCGRWNKQFVPTLLSLSTASLYERVPGK